MANDTGNVFGIGLVMAGAVSAGSYTAGVVDFLMEALECWERRKRGDDPEAPRHHAEIRVATGASAGSITAAVFSSSLREAAYPVPGAPKPSPLYRTWVELVDISGLLDNGDLERNPEIRSALNSTRLDDISDEVLGQQAWSRPAEDWPAYVANPLHLYFTITNLRGVPYSIYFQGEEGSRYGMSLHADYMHFCLGPEGKATDTALPLEAVPGLTGHWRTMKEAALASAAFPVGLAARKLSRTGTLEYDTRLWPIPQSAPAQPGEPCVCQTQEAILPAWPEPWPSGEPPRTQWSFEFVNVDGGVANNEPFELARRCLAEDDARLPRRADQANRAVILVDPFPNEAAVDFGYQAERQLGLFPTLSALMGAVTSQLRFKTEELELAKNPEVFSRFIVAPTRWEGAGEQRRRARYALASGGLGGFGGFLAEAYRDHDYRLGRRNCQQFLRRIFILDEDNPVFQGAWTEAQKDKLRLSIDGQRYLPIIPLFDACAEEMPEPPWPKGKLRDLSALRKQLSARAEKLVQSFVQTRVDSGWDRFVLRSGWRIFQLRKQLFGKDAVDPVIEAIQADLEKRNLL